jgi:transcriptional regulator with XRE-family HTH domain
LAARSGVSDGAVGWFESGKRARERTIVKIRRALADAGVEFPEGEPPRLKAADE